MVLSIGEAAARAVSSSRPWRNTSPDVSASQQRIPHMVLPSDLLRHVFPQAMHTWYLRISRVEKLRN